MVRLWDPFRTWDMYELDVDRLFSRTPTAGNPPINVYTAQDDVMVMTELPGIDPAHVDLAVTGDTLTLKGERKALQENEKGTWHRQERGYGDFIRTVRLPFNVDCSKVDARYEKGVLKIALTKAESDKPRKICVRTVE